MFGVPDQKFGEEICAWIVLKPGQSATEEEILYADVNLADARRKRNWNEYNQVLRDRRSDVYDEMLGSDAARGWY